MLNHGWIGGITYLAMVLTTLAIGFRCALMRTPWQDHLIVVFAAYFGLSLESAIVDTDHWRHYYLFLGVIWGMSAATINYVRQQRHNASVTPAGIQPDYQLAPTTVPS